MLDADLLADTLGHNLVPERSKISAYDAIKALREIRCQPATAKQIAEQINRRFGMDTDSRAVATAMRQPVKDGRVRIRYHGGIGHYRYVRMRARPA